MRSATLPLIYLALLAGSPAAVAADATACMNCHDADEFSGASADEIIAGATDPGIPPHKRFADVSAEELQAIAEELSGS